MLSTLISAIAGLPKELIVVVVAMLPVIELRGAIPVGVAPPLSLPLPKVFLLAMLGNMLPVPFILLLLGPLRKRANGWPVIGPALRWAEERANKRRHQVEKYGFWGLVSFVGIPLPGTGAWTGALIAVILELPFRMALGAITLGVLAAGVILSILAGLGLMAFQ